MQNLTTDITITSNVLHHKYSVYWEFGPHKYGVYWNSDPTSTVCVGNLVPTSDQAPTISSWLYFLTILRTNSYFINSIVSTQLLLNSRVYGQKAIETVLTHCK